ncbi:MAG: DUF3126 family protein [Hyphomicrobiaceae bacterium]|nr:DUF3126 family protein [Hyphomicrobiaceae bacterium]
MQQGAGPLAPSLTPWLADRRQINYPDRRKSTVRNDIPRLQRFLQQRFGLTTIEVRPAGKKTDMAEVYIKDEFIGTITRDDEDEETTFYFEMPILEVDFEGV